MHIQVLKDDLSRHKTQAAVLINFEGEAKILGVGQEFYSKAGGQIARVIDLGDFKGKNGELSLHYTEDGCLVKRVIIVGMGKRKDLSLERIREGFARAAQKVRSLRLDEFSLSLDFGNLGLPIESVAEAAVEGVILGLYTYLPYKTVEEDNKQKISSLNIYTGNNDLKKVREAVKGAEVVAQAVCFARDLVSAPANEMTPSILAERAKSSLRQKDTKVSVLNKEDMKKLGMNALLGVARGSHEPPRMIVIKYTGGKKSAKPVVLVGKGITFDSGGISIKPAENMDRMKTDMAGGAAVIAIIKAVSELGFGMNLVGIVPATENLPGGNAYKPGDILKSLSGKTIEVVNTDAEGRVILADALAYACRFKPGVIIDLATLTGACIVALGDHVIGMMGTAEDVKKGILRAADVTGEKTWELPLGEIYDDLIKSDVADYKNSGGRAGGAITAAAFLQKFVGDCPWVHLDIAGPSWLEKDRPYIPKGASGVGVRLLVRLFRDLFLEKNKNDS